MTRTGQSGVDKLTQYVASQRFLLEEVARLQEENEELKLAASELPLLHDDRERLACLLDLSFNQTGHVVPAKVLGRSMDTWNEFLVLDRGRKHGVVDLSPVVCNDGVVGHIVEVRSSTSKVQLILQQHAGVPVIVEDLGTQGVAMGNGTSRLSMRFFLYERQELLGLKLSTTGLAGIYPPGVPVGTIRDSYRNANEEVIGAEVIPAVNFSKVSEVLILDPIGFPEEEIEQVDEQLLDKSLTTAREEEPHVAQNISAE